MYPHSEMIAELGLAGSIVEIAKSAATAAAKEAAADALSDTAAAWVRTVSVEVVGSLGGSIVGALLKLLLNVSDKVSTKLDLIIAAPLKTGARIVTEASALSGGSQAEIGFRDRLLNDGILELERAWTLADGRRSRYTEQFYIRLLQGLAAKCMTGGAGYARVRLTECAEELEQEAREISRRLEELALEDRSQKEWAEQHAKMRELYIRLGTDARSAYSSGAAARQCEKRCIQIAEENSQLIPSVKWVQEFAAMLRAIQ